MVAHPVSGWKKEILAAVAKKIEREINPEKQGVALANVARVLLWAGKTDDAAQIAKRALTVGGKYQEVVINAGTSLATAYARNGSINMH